MQIDIQKEGNLTKIDVREIIRKGQHPRGEILKVVEQAEANSVFEIHVPHYTKPLVDNLKSMGLQVVVKELETQHFVLLAAKL